MDWFVFSTGEGLRIDGIPVGPARDRWPLHSATLRLGGQIYAMRLSHFQGWYRENWGAPS